MDDYSGSILKQNDPPPHNLVSPGALSPPLPPDGLRRP